MLGGVHVDVARAATTVAVTLSANDTVVPPTVIATAVSVTTAVCFFMVFLIAGNPRVRGTDVVPGRDARPGGRTP